MGKTSPYTGTQKKAIKAESKTRKFKAEEEVKEIKHNRSYKRSAQHDIRQLGKGKYSPPTDVRALSKEFTEAQKYAGKQAKAQFAPIQEKAISDYQRFTQPSQAAQYAPNSSAAKQALKQGNEDLQRTLASDFSNLQNSIAGNYMNQLSGNRNLDVNTRLQSNASLVGQPVQAVYGGHPNAYNQQQASQQQDWGTSIGNLATGAAALYAASSSEIKENIQDCDLGLDAVRDMDVKIYDYIGPVDGRQTGRVGLIAEDVPEEIQGMLGDIKAVDVYGLVAVLVNAVKELDAKVKELEAKVQYV